MVSILIIMSALEHDYYGRLLLQGNPRGYAESLDDPVQDRTLTGAE